MKEKNKQNKQFLMVDYEILKISEIVVNGKKEKFNDASKNLYCYIRNWPEAFPSHNKIAEVFGITRKAAEQRIKKLLELGLIERIERPGTSNLYHVKPITEEMKTGRSYSENKGTNYEDKNDNATPNLKQQPQEPTINHDIPEWARTEDEPEWERVTCVEDDGAVPPLPQDWNNVPAFSESDLRDAPPSYFEEEEQEDIASASKPESKPKSTYKEDEGFWRSVPIASSKPAPKYSSAALFENLSGGVAAAPASRTPTTSSVDDDDWGREPF